MFMNLKYEPAPEPLHISAKLLFRYPTVVREEPTAGTCFDSRVWRCVIQRCMRLKTRESGGHGWVTSESRRQHDCRYSTVVL